MGLEDTTYFSDVQPGQQTAVVAQGPSMAGGLLSDIDWGSILNGIGGAIALPSDIKDAQAVGASVDTTRAQAGQPKETPWWQTVITFGLNKVIDNQWSKPNTTGNTSPGSFAGQSGQTYNQTATPTSPAVGAVKSADASSGGLVGLAIVAGLGLLILRG